MKLLTLARDLKRRRGRERQGLFVAEGVRAVRELLHSPLAVRGLLAGPNTAMDGVADLLDVARSRGIEILGVDGPAFESAADTESPQGILAIGEVPSRSLASLRIDTRARVLVLDAVQDPGNAGTLIRTAAALGAVATIALPGTVDLWNAKVIRGAMGTHFVHHAVFCGYREFDEFIDREGFALWGADTGGDSIDGVSAPDRLAIAVGNEGNGLTNELRSRVERSIALPIAPTVESLNVAVAAGILLHVFRA